MRAVWSIVFFLAACAGAPDGGGRGDGDAGPTDPAPTTGDTGTSEDTGLGCVAEFAGITPVDGQFSVSVEPTITVAFDRPVVEGQWSVEVQDVEGEAELSVDGTVATFEPYAPLEFGTQYVVLIEVCGVPTATKFTTVADALDPLSLEGKTFGVPWGDLTFTEPANGAFLRDSLDVDKVLVQFVDVNAVTLEIDTAVAIANDGTGGPEPFCDTYLQETGDFSANPIFEFGPQRVDIPLNSTTDIAVEDLTLTAEVSQDGDKLLYAELTGLVATEALLPEPCEKSVKVSKLLLGTCEKCTISDSGMCLLLEASVGEAPEEVGFDLDGECNP